MFNLYEAWFATAGSRCKDDDDRELDILEFYKYFSMVLCQLSATAFYNLTSAIWNPWQLLNFFQMLIIAPVISA